MRVPRRFLLATSLALTFQSACASTPPPPPPAKALVPDAKVYHRAETGRASLLEREVERLRADLSAAEDALVAAESGLRGNRTRADAISALAEAHIDVDRARERWPWLETQLAEADEKLLEAERQIEAGNFGAAVFFTWRAQRIAERSNEEARLAGSTPGVLKIRSARVNLREGPSTKASVVTVLTNGMPVFPERTVEEWMLVRTASGRVGWVHASLVR